MIRKTLPNASSLRSEILSGDRNALSQGITLLENKNKDRQDEALKLIDFLLPFTGNSIRIGITGAPGVGKSTFINVFGSLLTSLGKKVAVLSIDPSSSLSGGSILGDKTRMTQLANDPGAFIRPSPSGDVMGGVANKTREIIYLCEAAGYEIILIETVGVGQSETMVKDMVDLLILLTMSGGGDELQGIKRGIMELADVVIVNKVDGDRKDASKNVLASYRQVLRLFRPLSNGWSIPVLSCSSTEKTGLDTVWSQINAYEAHTKKNGHWDQNRQRQLLKWFEHSVQQNLQERFLSQKNQQLLINTLKQSILKDEISVGKAVQAFFDSLK